MLLLVIAAARVCSISGRSLLAMLGTMGETPSYLKLGPVGLGPTQCGWILNPSTPVERAGTIYDLGEYITSSRDSNVPINQNEYLISLAVIIKEELLLF